MARGSFPGSCRRRIGLLFASLLLWSACAAVPPLTWFWANPLPHGNNVYDLAYLSGLTVQVGDRGQLHISLDRNLWVPQSTRTESALRAATFFQNRLLVTGESGTVVYGEFASLTNLSVPAPLTLIDLQTPDWLEGVAASATTAVAVGDNGAVYTSSDGTNWARQAQTFSTWLRSVAFGQNLFVAVGEGGFIAASTDGLKWTKRTSGTTKNLNRVTAIGNQWIVVGDGGAVLRSPNKDATQWSAFNPASGATNDLYFVTAVTNTLGIATLVGGASDLRLHQPLLGWSDETSRSKTFPAPKWPYYCGFWDGLYHAVGGSSGMFVEGFATNIVSTSLQWVTTSDSLRTWLWDVTRVGGRYYAAGDLGTIQSSKDGVNWEVELVPGLATNSVLLGVGGRADLLVAAGTKGTLLTSSNGVVWTAVSPAPVANDLQGVAVLGNEVYVTGGAGTVLSSTDGRSWRLRGNLAPSFLSSITAYPQGLVCVGADGLVFTSPEGAGWTRRSTGTTNWLSRVRYVGGQLLAVGEQGTILASLDGTNWVSRPSGTTAWLNDVACFNGAFYVAGTQGTVLVSPDATNWTSVGSITQKSLYAMASDRNQLITVGIEGLILRGQPGPLVILDYQRVQGTNAFQLSGPPGRQLQLEMAPGVSVWTNLAQARFLNNSGSLILGEARANPPPQASFRGRVLP